MIYLDYNATHPPETELLRESLEEYFTLFANPSGLSNFSQKSRTRLEFYRTQIAEELNISSSAIRFTPSATIANALAIKMLKAVSSGSKQFQISPFEHPSIIENIYPEAKIFPFPRSDQYLTDLIDVESAWLCSMAHNETGIMILNEQDFSSSQWKIVDGAQTIARLHPDTLRSAISTLHNNRGFFTFSGHKIGAGLGLGVLILPKEFLLCLEDLSSKDRKALNLWQGGDQESGNVPGTENLFSIISISKVLQKRFSAQNNFIETQAVQKSFENLIKTSNLDCQIIGDKYKRSPGTSLISFPQTQIDFLMMYLDKQNITVSTGTSCKSRSRTPSNALLSMGVTENQALSVIRFSFDHNFNHNKQKELITSLNNSGLIQSS